MAVTRWKKVSLRISNKRRLISVRQMKEISELRWVRIKVAQLKRFCAEKGYGQMAPATVWGRVFCIFYAIFGIPITGLMLKSIGERITEGIADFWRIIDRRLFNRDPKSIHMKTVLTVFALVITMLLVLAALAVEYEGWTYFQGIYFGFITLSTIGFGDYVPAHPSKDETNHPAFVIIFTLITFLYFTVGLALVSSALLAISRLFEDEPPWGFISLMNQDDDEEERMMREKVQAMSRAAGTDG
ncbi:potassium channel subfamily K member 3 isoform X2 [Nematostella vectensis]|uniref:potassium channel subfamily K member 3 isoform X2 n=1 Tax=Nematostella vectensis TaxID=45351 RepID=UPI002076FCE8|nr:potassium channel subfamily K member 3 isoform X2 [Nematostella vectensis]